MSRKYPIIYLSLSLVYLIDLNWEPLANFYCRHHLPTS